MHTAAQIYSHVCMYTAIYTAVYTYIYTHTGTSITSVAIVYTCIQPHIYMYTLIPPQPLPPPPHLPLLSSLLHPHLSSRSVATFSSSPCVSGPRSGHGHPISDHELGWGSDCGGKQKRNLLRVETAQGGTGIPHTSHPLYASSTIFVC